MPKHLESGAVFKKKWPKPLTRPSRKLISDINLAHRDLPKHLECGSVFFLKNRPKPSTSPLRTLVTKFEQTDFMASTDAGLRYI